MVGFILTYDNILFLYLYLLPTTIINVYMHFYIKTNIYNQTHSQAKQFYIKLDLFSICYDIIFILIINYQINTFEKKWYA
jgi:hypothetical protein